MNRRLAALVASSFVLVTAWSAMAQPIFVSTRLPAEFRGTDAVVVDLNADGIRDAVVKSDTLGPASFLGDAAGRLALHGSYSAGFAAVKFALGDVDGDGKTDLIVTGNGADTKIAVMFGDGAGGFGSPVVQALEFAPGVVQAADLDADGDDDIVVSTFRKIQVLFSDGTGAFTALPTATLADYAQFRFAELSGDAYLDLVVEEDTVLKIQAGDGAGGFAAPVVVSTGLTVGDGLVIADMDGDEDLDFVVPGVLGSFPNHQTKIAVILDNGASYDAATLLAIHTQVPSVVVAEPRNGNRASITGACKLDGVPLLCHFVGTASGWNPYYILSGPTGERGLVAVPKDDLGEARVLALSVDAPAEFWPDGTGELRNGSIYFTGRNGLTSKTPTAADFDGDGDQEVFVVGPQVMDYWKNNGAGNMDIGAWFNYASGTVSSNWLRTGDFDGNGRGDLFVDLNNTVGVVVLGAQGGPASNAAGAFYQFPGTVTDAVFGDFDGNAAQEVAVLALNAGTTGARFSIARSGTSTVQNVAVPDGQARSITVGDFNADGRLDAAIGYLASARATVLLNQGGGSAFTASTTNLPSGEAAATELQLLGGDMDGDGDADLVYLTPTSVGLLRSNGNGSFTADGAVAFNSTLLRDAFLQDMDGDSDLDCVALDTVQKAVTLWVNDGNGALALENSYLTRAEPLSIGVADLDGDHHRDVLVRYSGAVEALLGDPTLPEYNGAPVARNSGATLNLSTGATVSGTLSATDPDGDALTYAITQVSIGTVTAFNPATGAYTWQAPAGYAGNASVKFTVNDGKLTSPPGTLTVAVTAPSVDLKIVAANPLGTPHPGSNLAFKFTVAGVTYKISTSRVSVTALVPANTSFVSATIPGGSCELVANRVTCTQTGVFPARGKAIGYMTFKANAAGVVAYTPTVSAMTRDPLPKNNTYTVKKTVAK